MDKLLRLCSRGIGKHLTILNEQMPTPFSVNNLLQFLIVSVNFAEFLEQESKVDVQSMSLVYGVMSSFSKELEYPLLSPCLGGGLESGL